jgi:hypothetical protein
MLEPRRSAVRVLRERVILMMEYLTAERVLDVLVTTISPLVEVRLHAKRRFLLVAPGGKPP